MSGWFPIAAELEKHEVAPAVPLVTWDTESVATQSTTGLAGTVMSS